MARLVRHDQAGPHKIDPATWPRDEQGNLKAIWVCACGLSRTFPLCDKTHKTTSMQEEGGCLYRYDPATMSVVEKTRERVDDPTSPN